jgi:hypothetical protein
VDDVVKRVHGEDDQGGALGGEEAYSRGDKESEHAYQEVYGSEDGGDQAIGRSAHGPNLPVMAGKPGRPAEPRLGLSSSDSDHLCRWMGGGWE